MTHRDPGDLGSPGLAGNYSTFVLDQEEYASGILQILTEKAQSRPIRK